MRKVISRISGFPEMMMFVLLFCGMIFAQGASVNLTLSVKKGDYAKVKNAIEAVKGMVRFEHKYIDAVSVTVPSAQVSAITSLPEVTGAKKDQLVSLPVPRDVVREGSVVMPGIYTVAADNVKAMSVKEMKAALGPGPNNYYPYTNNLTNTNAFYNAVGHYGEDVIVAVIDAGISSAAFLVADRIIYGENFTGDGFSATSSSNNSHGTWVACCIGANGIVGFTNPLIANTIKKYTPESVLPNYFGAGLDGVPLVGQAPEAKFMAFKVFPYNSNSTETSVIIAALERVIQLKEQYLNGQGGYNIKIVNMSLGGLTFFAGNDPDYAAIIKRAMDDGIFFAVSAGNEGPSGMTIGDPGDVKNVVTAGASNDATHDRIVADLIYGPNKGFSYRPLNNNLMADFSSRGPNADGRPDPDIAAPGVYRLAESASGTSFSFVSGTSFAAPTVAGAAALLISALPDATPAQLRGALLCGANRTAISGNATMQDQGYGFIDVYNSYLRLRSGVFNPPDIGLTAPFVAANAGLQGLVNIVASPNVVRTTGQLEPGQRYEIYYPITSLTRKVTVTVSGITPQLPPAQQNKMFGDDIYFAITSAVTSRSDYLQGTPDFLTSDRTYVLEGQDLSVGLMRITAMGDWTNAGNVTAVISIQGESAAPNEVPKVAAAISQGQTKTYNIKVPQGASNLTARLNWVNGWNMLPTSDLDIVLTDPNGKAVILDVNGDGIPDGQSYLMPEIISVNNPAAGTWHASVTGFAILTNNKEQFQLYTDIFSKAILAKDGTGQETDAAVPKEFALAQNMPNPFNPSTVIKYDLPSSSGISLKIYNGLGQLVRTLVDQVQPAGRYSVVFDGKDNSGSQLASGMYIYQITAGSFVKSSKMLLLK